MYTFDKITHIHILFSLWSSETNSKHMRYTHAQSHARTHARTHAQLHTRAYTRFRLYVTTHTRTSTIVQTNKHQSVQYFKYNRYKLHKTSQYMPS